MLYKEQMPLYLNASTQPDHLKLPATILQQPNTSGVMVFLKQRKTVIFKYYGITWLWSLKLWFLDTAVSEYCNIQTGLSSNRKQFCAQGQTPAIVPLFLCW
jgi:hypothetical protein